MTKLLLITPSSLRSLINHRFLELLLRLLHIHSLVFSRIPSFPTYCPTLSKMIPSMSPSELNKNESPASSKQSSAKINTKLKVQITLMVAVVRPIAAATGTEGTAIAANQGSAAPITEPAKAVVPAAMAAYFYHHPNKNNKISTSNYVIVPVELSSQKKRQD